MEYKNTEITVDDLISKLNEEKIKLNPPFQRHQVWKLSDRRKLIKNMLLERPIPALFLFKRGEGIKTVSYVLDGKQRLESLVLFIADSRQDAKIKRPNQFFFQKPDVISQLRFDVQTKRDAPLVNFADIDSETARKFLLYRIAVIEVDFPDGDDEQSNMLDVIQLFIDINESGRKVKKIEIVRALSESIQRDELFSSLFKLVGVVQPRHSGRSLFNKPIQSDYTFVLKRLRDVNRALDSKTQIDVMWERLHELAMFAKTGVHRKPSDILKGMIAGARNKALTKAEQTKLKRVFKFLAKSYKTVQALESSKFATDQPQFYTMATALLSSDLLDKIPEDELATLLARFAAIANKVSQAPNQDIATQARTYMDATLKQTTDPNKRKQRHDALVQGVKLLRVV